MEEVGTTFGTTTYAYKNTATARGHWLENNKTQELQICVSNELLQHYSVTESAAEHDGASKHRNNIEYSAAATILSFISFFAQLQWCAQLSFANWI